MELTAERKSEIQKQERLVFNPYLPALNPIFPELTPSFPN